MKTIACVLCVVLAVSSCSEPKERRFDAPKRDDYPLGFDELRPLAEHGDAGAQFWLGQM